MPNGESKPTQYVRAWRKRARMTQEKLAEVIGAKTSTISMIENGHQGLTIDKLAEIADALGIEPADLLTPPPSVDQAKAETIRREILSIYDRLPEGLKPVYLAQARALLGAVPKSEEK